MAKKPKPRLKVVKSQEPESPPSDHNLSPDQRVALHHNHVRKYEEAVRRKDRAAADLRNVCKLIKAEGGTLEAIKLSVKLQSPEGEKAVRLQIEEMIRIARWMGASVGYQMEMFEDRRPATDRAYDDGKVAGLSGQIRKPPFSEPSLPQYQRWLEGWGDGQAGLAMKLKAPKAPKQKVKAPQPDAPAAE